LNSTTRFAQSTLKDFTIVYECRFDDSASKMFGDTTIPTFETHCQWMKEQVLKKRSTFIIACDHLGDFGFVRFAKGRHSPDYKDVLGSIPNIWFVSIAVLPSHRSRGLGYKILKASEEKFITQELERPITLLTWARSDNPASWRIFEKANWNRNFIEGYREVAIRTIS